MQSDLTALRDMFVKPTVSSESDRRPAWRIFQSAYDFTFTPYIQKSKHITALLLYETAESYLCSVFEA